MSDSRRVLECLVPECSKVIPFPSTEEPAFPSETLPVFRGPDGGLWHRDEAGEPCGPMCLTVHPHTFEGFRGLRETGETILTTETKQLQSCEPGGSVRRDVAKVIAPSNSQKEVS